MPEVDHDAVVRLVLAGQTPPAAWIPHITELRLERARITDLRALAPLTGLRRLILSNTLVSDITPLAALTGLRRLELTRSRVGNVTALAALSMLRDMPRFSRALADFPKARPHRPLLLLTYPFARPRVSILTPRSRTTVRCPRVGTQAGGGRMMFCHTRMEQVTM